MCLPIMEECLSVFLHKFCQMLMSILCTVVYVDTQYAFDNMIWYIPCFTYIGFSYLTFAMLVGIAMEGKCSGMEVLYILVAGLFLFTVCWITLVKLLRQLVTDLNPEISCRLVWVGIFNTMTIGMIFSDILYTCLRQ